MPKRTSSGMVKYRSRGSRRVARKTYSRRKVTRTRRGFTAGYSFHRWITAFTGSGNPNVTNCTYDTGTSVITSTVGQSTCGVTFTFSLADLPNVSEFTSLFDSYMITGVMLQIKMINNPNSDFEVNNPIPPTSSDYQSTNFYPTIWYAMDHDDSDTLTLPQIKERERVRHKVLQPNRELNIMCRPTTLTQLYRSTTTTGYAENRKRAWLDMSQTDIPHYSVKMVFDLEGLASVTSFFFKVNAKYYFKTKTVR